MAGRIYLLQDGSELVAMEEAKYDSEALLQGMLARYPDLLAGDQMNTQQPRRWLLVAREMTVPGEESGAARWYLDHLFLDQEAIPTLVEVKRSSDTRIRREVVGQMLDYAANAVVYWPVEEITAKFEARCVSEGEDPEQVVAQFVDENQDPAEFWQQVKTNLQAGRIRLVFVADAIPAELRRVIEFLNQQMDPAEVLAIEVKQFVGDGVKTLVPRVLGQTEIARQKKSTGGATRQKISADDYFAAINSEHSPAVANVFRRLVEWGRKNGLEDNFGTGGKGTYYIPAMSLGGHTLYPLSLRTKGMVILQMRWLKDYPPFQDAAKREELEKMLNQIPGFRMTDAAGMEGYPKVPVTSLVDDGMMLRLTKTLDWVLLQLRGAPSLG